MSSSVRTLLQQPSDHLDRFVLWRALPGCCVATSLVACPGSSIARELIPLGGGIGGDTAAILLGLKLYNSFPFLHRYITLIAGSHHLISQAGWNRCNLSIYLSIDPCRYLHRAVGAFTHVLLARARSGRHVFVLVCIARMPAQGFP